MSTVHIPARGEFRAALAKTTTPHLLTLRIYILQALEVYDKYEIKDVEFEGFSDRLEDVEAEMATRNIKL